MNSRSNRALLISTNSLVDCYMVLYLCIPMLTLVFGKLFSFVGLSEYGAKFAILLAYIPLVVLFAYYGAQGRKLKEFIPDFWILLIAIAIFFVITYMIHPEYQHWYFRSTYGVLPYIFRPDNGIYLYLAIRLVNDPKRILTNICISGWIMYVYYALQLFQSLSRGYWIDSSNKGYEIHMSYSLSFGYNVLLFVLVFFYLALETKSAINWIGFLLGFFMVLLGGSRGPILDIGIFIILYIFIKINESKKKRMMMAIAAVGIGVFVIINKYIISTAASVMNQFGFSSRFVTMMLKGDVFDGNGRAIIWEAAVNMIKENPLGYGAMGSRHVIGNLIFVGHPHQFFLEVLIDFGVIVGSALIIWMIVSTYRILTQKHNEKWLGVFIVFFARACQLLVSLTFWHSIGLWGVIAVGVCISLSKKRGDIANVQKQDS